MEDISIGGPRIRSPRVESRREMPTPARTEPSPKKDTYTSSGPEASPSPVGALTSALGETYRCGVEVRAGHRETIASVSGCSDKTLRSFPVAPHGYAARYDELSGRRVAETCTLRRRAGDVLSEKFSGKGCTDERKKLLRSTVNYTEASRPYTHGSPADDKRSLEAPRSFVRTAAPAPAHLPAAPVSPGDGIHVQRTGSVPGAGHLTTGLQATLGGNVSDRQLSGKPGDSDVSLPRACTLVDHYGLDRDMQRTHRTHRTLSYSGEGCTPAAEFALAERVRRERQHEGLLHGGRERASWASDQLSSLKPTEATFTDDQNRMIHTPGWEY